MTNKVPIDLDSDVIYKGDNEEIRELTKMLLETTLQLNAYQNDYDKMRNQHEIKELLASLKGQSNEEYLQHTENLILKTKIEILEWVLNGSKTEEEYWEENTEKLTPQEEKELVENILESYNHQISAEEYLEDLEDDIQ